MNLFVMKQIVKKFIKRAGYTLNIKLEKEEMMFISEIIQEK
jgi:hypothetical protein